MGNRYFTPRETSLGYEIDANGIPFLCSLGNHRISFHMANSICKALNKRRSNRIAGTKKSSRTRAINRANSEIARRTDKRPY